MDLGPSLPGKISVPLLSNNTNLFGSNILSKKSSVYFLIPEKKKKASSVWQFVETLSDGEMRCRICGRVMISTTSGNWARHHRVRHPDIYKLITDMPENIVLEFEENESDDDTTDKEKDVERKDESDSDEEKDVDEKDDAKDD